MNEQKTDFGIKNTTPQTRVVALAGNPNVGKSTIFNQLTGMKQHTGNWPGKTVENARGMCKSESNDYIMVDLPGTYSLMAHSAEEEAARDFICFGEPDATVVVCDATCLERNMNLVLQTLEMTDDVIICVNLLDEARRKKIVIDLNALALKCGVRVVGTEARRKAGIKALLRQLDLLCEAPSAKMPPLVTYSPLTERAIAMVLPAAKELCGKKISPRWLALRFLCNDSDLLGSFEQHSPKLDEALSDALAFLKENGADPTSICDEVTAAIGKKAKDICKTAVVSLPESAGALDRKLDRVLSGRYSGFPIMFLLLALVLWITISGANYPSQWLSRGFFWLEAQMLDFFKATSLPPFVYELPILGVYRVTAWVISVMLPPMAIFFPLFTLLEDLGYLPRVAFNLDKCFKRCNACGKQALTMCMGFGCNSAGVIGCRIIDSRRERLIAILTNNFVPCNGRFPTLIAIITMFFVGTKATACSALYSALLLSFFIILGIAMTLFTSRLLSKTALRGVPSSFTLELPPYRPPQVGKIIVRSIFDRTLFVLGRAVVVAMPAGLLLWLMANISVGNATILAHCAGFLDPFAKLLGLDGVILLAFILGIPANEIVVPIIIMAYLATGNILDMSDLTALKALLVQNGWTYITALCTMLFSLMHWPCATTLITIRKETGSLRQTAAAFLIPTASGVVICFIVAQAARLFGL